jgi:hypothetical protein
MHKHNLAKGVAKSCRREFAIHFLLRGHEKHVDEVKNCGECAKKVDAALGSIPAAEMSSRRLLPSFLVGRSSGWLGPVAVDSADEGSEVLGLLKAILLSRHLVGVSLLEDRYVYIYAYR